MLNGNIHLCQFSDLNKSALNEFSGILSAEIIKIFGAEHFIFFNICQNIRISFPIGTKCVIRNFKDPVLESIMKCIFAGADVIKEDGDFIYHIHSFRGSRCTNEMCSGKCCLKVFHALQSFRSTQSMTFITDNQISTL